MSSDAAPWRQRNFRWLWTGMCVSTLGSHAAGIVYPLLALWLAVEPMDLRAGAERLPASVVQVFGSAQAHHGYPPLTGTADQNQPNVSGRWQPVGDNPALKQGEALWCFKPQRVIVEPCATNEKRCDLSRITACAKEE